MNLKDIALSEISQTQRNKYCMTSYEHTHTHTHIHIHTHMKSKIVKIREPESITVVPRV